MDAGDDRLIKGARWQRLRRSFLVRNPLCVMCKEKGRQVRANEVDHIIPRCDLTEANDVYDWSNLRALCKPCHSRRTNRDQCESRKQIKVALDWCNKR